MAKKAPNTVFLALSILSIKGIVFDMYGGLQKNYNM